MRLVAESPTDWDVASRRALAECDSLERRRVPRTFWGSNEPRADAVAPWRAMRPHLIQMGVWCASAADVQAKNRVRPRGARAFRLARQYARGLGIRSALDWRQFVKSGQLPNDIPRAPHLTYQGKGRVSWPDWLGVRASSKGNRRKRRRTDLVRTGSLNYPRWTCSGLATAPGPQVTWRAAY